MLADGTRALLPRTAEYLDLYAVAEDRVEEPVRARAYVVRSGVVPVNGCATSALHVVIIDPERGCGALETSWAE